MGEFPLFVDLEGVPCLIAGGGRVALRKARALLACAPRLTVAAPRFLPEFQALEQLRGFCGWLLLGQRELPYPALDRL